MNGVTILREQFSAEMYASPEAQQMGRPILRLLMIGRESGFTTSLTEAQSYTLPDSLAKRFQSLVEVWRRECAHLASIREAVLHPAYQQIVGMGPRALPLIFAELERKPDHWFWALRGITQADPVLPEHRGDIAQMTKDWLRWAKKKGIHW